MIVRFIAFEPRSSVKFPFILFGENFKLDNVWSQKLWSKQLLWFVLCKIHCFFFIIYYFSWCTKLYFLFTKRGIELRHSIVNALRISRSEERKSLNGNENLNTRSPRFCLRFRKIFLWHNILLIKFSSLLIK